MNQVESTLANQSRHAEPAWRHVPHPLRSKGWGIELLCIRGGAFVGNTGLQPQLTRGTTHMARHLSGKLGQSHSPPLLRRDGAPSLTQVGLHSIGDSCRALRSGNGIVWACDTEDTA